ncbi:MAG TPA: CheR family methyltransferase, partial [Thermoanaerobaculia bacterium]|nr:CheR family methyltransferase [Thermoanaerobaculia bacterium]
AALRTTDPEAAFTVLEIPAGPGERAALGILLSHPWPAVRAATLGRLPAGAAPLSDLVGLLAEERADTSLAAAFSLAAESRGSEPSRARACRSALLDRARGPDGPGRASAVRALGRSVDPGTASALSRAMGSPDPGVRAAGAAAAAFQRGVRDEDLRSLLRDEAADVRAAALRSLTRRAERRAWTGALARRELLPLLADEPRVAAAAAAAIVAAAGTDRPRIVCEMLAERGPVRRGAIEEIPATRDRLAAEAVIAAATHEDTETARLVLRAMAVARPEIAERVLVDGLRARRAEVRAAAAAAILECPSPVDSDGALAEALAEALDHESDDEVLEELFEAVPVNGGRRCLEAVLRRLASGEPSRGSEAAIEALAQRFPEDVRRAWESAPSRLAARLAHALAVASGARPRAAMATGLPPGVCRLFGHLVRRRTGLAFRAASRRRLELRLWAEARAAGSFPRLLAVLRESPTESPLFGRLLDAVSPPGRGFRPRDAGHQALADEILPERLLSRGTDGTFDVWCVGCGTGEEPHALAMLLVEKGLGETGRVRIKGSDLSHEALEVAASGTYARHAVAALPADQRARHFVVAGAGALRLSVEVRALVRFSLRGLFDEPRGSATYDAIFCRTLLQGLEEDVRSRAGETLATFLKPGGYLLLGEGDGRAAASAPLTLVRLGADVAWRR